MEISNNESHLFDFFLYSVRDMFGGENYLVKKLPRLKELATARQLKLAIDQHLELTIEHAARLIKVFALIGEKPAAVKCEAMHGFISDVGDAVANTEKETAVRDLAINFACQKIESYEMTTYKGLSDLATTLGFMEVASLLNQTYREEHESFVILKGMSEILTNKAISGNQFVV